MWEPPLLSRPQIRAVESESTQRVADPIVFRICHRLWNSYREIQ